MEICSILDKYRYQNNLKVIKTHLQQNISVNCIFIRQLLFNEKAKIVSKFKDFLIFDDNTDYMKRFYYKNEFSQKSTSFIKYYIENTIFYPNYITSKECRYLKSNFEKKKRIISKKNIVNNEHDGIGKSNILKSIESSRFSNNFDSKFTESSPIYHKANEHFGKGLKDLEIPKRIKSNSSIINDLNLFQDNRIKIEEKRNIISSNYYSFSTKVEKILKSKIQKTENINLLTPSNICSNNDMNKNIKKSPQIQFKLPKQEDIKILKSDIQKKLKDNELVYKRLKVDFNKYSKIKSPSSKSNTKRPSKILPKKLTLSNNTTYNNIFDKAKTQNSPQINSTKSNISIFQTIDSNKSKDKSKNFDYQNSNYNIKKLILLSSRRSNVVKKDSSNSTTPKSGINENKLLVSPEIFKRKSDSKKVEIPRIELDLTKELELASFKLTPKKPIIGKLQNNKSNQLNRLNLNNKASPQNQNNNDKQRKKTSSTSTSIKNYN